jgi:hypothetical protein
VKFLKYGNHWALILADAALTSTSNSIRQLFAIILMTCNPAKSSTPWEKYKNYMTEDILHRVKQTNQCSNMNFTQQMYNEAQILIEDLCILISNFST